MVVNEATDLSGYGFYSIGNSFWEAGFSYRKCGTYVSQLRGCTDLRPQKPVELKIEPAQCMLLPLKKGGALVSTRSLKRRRHVEDGSLASLKSGPKKINADHQDLALAA